MATQTLMQITYKKERGGLRISRGGPEEPEYIEAASQSWDIGDLVFMSSGKLTICAVNGSNQSSGQIFGQVPYDAAGVTDTQTQVFPITPQQRFYANVYHATQASAVTAQTQLGTIRALVRISGKWHVDIENAVEGAGNALGRVTIVGFPQKNPQGTDNAIGDIYGFVEVKFIPYSVDLTDSVPFVRVLQYEG